MAYKTNNTMTDTLWLVGGGVVGAGLALLFAPKTGKRTRAEIVRFGKNLNRRSDKAVREFSAHISDFADKAGERAVDILHSGQSLSRDAKKGILGAIEKGQYTLEHQKRRLARMIG